MSLYTRLQKALKYFIVYSKDEEMADLQHDVTLEDFEEAKQLLKDYKVCGNYCYGCNKVFKTKETTRTLQYGKTYYWCASCYKGIKDW